MKQYAKKRRRKINKSKLKHNCIEIKHISFIFHKLYDSDDKNDNYIIKPKKYKY